MNLGLNLADHIESKLNQKLKSQIIYRAVRKPGASAVLFLLSKGTENMGPCLVLNKRADTVRQAGDLCCPGGGIERLDSVLSKLMFFKFSCLARWRFWPDWCKDRPSQAERLSLVLTTALRESFEEMRLNPFYIRFLGPLPSQHLLLFNQEIFPVVGMISRQRRFFPNREVEKIIHIPLKELINQKHYVELNIKIGEKKMTSPCFYYNKEILWGATYRIVTNFLDLVFDFKPTFTSPGLSFSLPSYLQNQKPAGY